MEENNESHGQPDLSECNNRMSDGNLEDDTEDYIQPSQPLSFQSSSLQSVMRKNSNENDVSEMDSSTIDETMPFPSSDRLTPVADVTNDFIPPTENPKRKMDSLEEIADDICKKRLNLDDTSLLKATPDLFSTQSENLNDTVDAAQLKVPESPPTAESQNASLVPESPLLINESMESENSGTVFTGRRDHRVLEETVADDSANDASVELGEMDSSKNDMCELSGPEAGNEKTEEDLSNNNNNNNNNSNNNNNNSNNNNNNDDTREDLPATDPAPRLLDNSDLWRVLISDNATDVVSEKRIESQLHDTIDIEDIDPFASEKTDTDPNNPNVVPPVSEDLISPVGPGPVSDSPRVESKLSKERLRMKGALKNVSDEESARLQKHSTPENPLSKSLKINESTSSIENGTPPVEDELKDTEINFTVLLQVNCQIVIDPIKKEPISKKIVNVKEFVKKQPKPIVLDPQSDSTKARLSSSSSGSVYSEKTSLPYALPERPSPASLITESSSSSSVDLAKHIQIAKRQVWTNEYMIPMAMDELLPRFIEESRQSKGKDGNHDSKRRVSARQRKKSHWSQPLDNVLEGSITDPFSVNNSDIQLPVLDKSEESKRVENGDEEDKSDSDRQLDQKEVEERRSERRSSERKEASPAVVAGEAVTPEDSLVEGLSVFAKWTDKRYYPGILGNKAKYDRWEVKFDDQTERVTREDIILPTSWLTKGELVFALVSDNYVSGKITDVIREGGIKFKVELDDKNEEVIVERSDLCLNEVMAGIIREKHRPASKLNVSVKSSEIDFDNVVVGKRIREQRTPIRTPGPAGPPGSSTIKKRKALKSVEEGKETPGPATTPVAKREATYSSSRRKPPKRDGSSENGEAWEGDRLDLDGGNPAGRETPVASSTRLGGADKRVRRLNYESDKPTSKKTKLAEGSEESVTSSGPTIQRKTRRSSSVLVREFGSTTDDSEGKEEEMPKPKGSAKSAASHKSSEKSPLLRSTTRARKKPAPTDPDGKKPKKKKNP